MKNVFMIVYAESGDEIHFIIIDGSLEKEYDKLYNEIIVTEVLTNRIFDRLEEFLSFVQDNKLDDMFLQTYTEENWFKNYNVTKVCYIPEFGY